MQFPPKKLSFTVKEPITISPAQAIILLIGLHEGEQDFFDIQAMKRLYLTGIVTRKDSELFECLRADPRLHGYHVSTDWTVIQDDPTRRYFETILAYHTVKNTISDLSLSDLKKTLETTLRRLKIYTYESQFTTIGEYITYNKSKGDASEMACNLSEKNKLYQALNEKNRYKYQLIFCMGHLPVNILARQLCSLPLDIYDQGIFLPHNRGRIKAKEPPSSIQMGILRSTMPAVHDESSDYRGMQPNKFSLSHEFHCVVPPLTRGPESSYPIHTAEWSSKAFNALFHPFVNSISGTMLMQLRWLYSIKTDSPFWSHDKLEQFLRIFIAAYLYSFGGHSLYEYVEVLHLDEIKDAFKELKRFEKINMTSLFLSGNEQAFETALSKTVRFTRTFIQNKCVHRELKERFTFFNAANTVAADPTASSESKAHTYA